MREKLRTHADTPESDLVCALYKALTWECFLLSCIMVFLGIKN